MDEDKKLGFIFSEVLTEIVSTISGFSIDVLSEDKDNDFEEMTGMMSLSGQNSGMLFISAKENDIRILCSYMIGVTQDEVTTSDIEDTLCELVNMTAGSVKLRLSGSDYMFNLSQPFLIKGQNKKLVTKNKTHIISKTLGNGEISIKLKVIH